MQETIQIARQLMTEHSVNYSGTLYRLSKAMLQVAPVQKPFPPIYVAANSPRTRKIAGMLGNGWIAQMMTPAMYERDLREVGLAAAEVGRSLQDIDVTYHANLGISGDYEEARRLAASLRGRCSYGGPSNL
jgi:phthiodiolone/phenolphthiodiolone dimycocerosates ketoreductase